MASTNGSAISRDDHGKADGGDGEREGQEDHEPNAAVALWPVGDGLCIAHWRIDIRHGLRKYPIRFDLTGHCHGRAGRQCVQGHDFGLNVP